VSSYSKTSPYSSHKNECIPKAIIYYDHFLAHMATSGNE